MILAGRWELPLGELPKLVLAAPVESEATSGNVTLASMRDKTACKLVIFLHLSKQAMGWPVAGSGLLPSSALSMGSARMK
jgi:hypothetical protein